jgi:hypothetical protein
MTTSTSTQIDSPLLPAPSVADLERWFADDLADYLQEHNGRLPSPVQFDAMDESWLKEDVDSDAAANVANVDAAPVAERSDEEYRIVSVDSSFFGAQSIQSPLTNPVVMQNKIARHLEERWKQGDRNLRALEGAALKLWIANGDPAELTYIDVVAVAQLVAQKLNAGEDTSKLKGELYPAHWRPATLKEILNRTEEPLRWTINGLLLENASNLTSGHPHAGKSLGWLAGAIQAVTTGKVWGKFRVSPSLKRVLYVETEDPRVLVETRVRELAKHMAASPADLYDAGFALSTTGPFDLVEVKDAIYRLLDAYKPDWLVLSTLQGLLGGRDWNQQNEMAEVNAMLVDLGRNFVPISVITHSPKDPRLQRAAGTITQEANHATVLHVRKQMLKDGQAKGKDLLTVSVDSKLYPVPSFELLIDSEPAPTDENPDARKLVSVSLASGDVSATVPSTAPAQADKRQKDDKRQAVAAYLATHPDATIREIEKNVGCSRETARKIRKQIRQESEDARLFGGGVESNGNDSADDETGQTPYA